MIFEIPPDDTVDLGRLYSIFLQNLTDILRRLDMPFETSQMRPDGGGQAVKILRDPQVEEDFLAGRRRLDQERPGRQRGHVLESPDLRDE